MPDVHLDCVDRENVFNLFDNRRARGFNAQDIVDLHDVVRFGTSLVHAGYAKDISIYF